MWYFSWILGFLLACSFAVLNAMWLEYHDAFKRDPQPTQQADHDQADPPPAS